jgi:hypothetical protein
MAACDEHLAQAPVPTGRGPPVPTEHKDGEEKYLLMQGNEHRPSSIFIL